VTRFAAVIGHSDDAPLLDACLRHHLGIGIEAVLVVTTRSDDASRAVLARFAGDERVRVSTLASADAGSVAFDYFTRAAREVRLWRDPEWLLFVDSDEFWIPERGSIVETRGLDDHDLFAVERFNVPPLYAADGAIGVADLATPARLPMLVGAGDLAEPYESGNARTPIVRGRDRSPKLLARAAFVAGIASGGHAMRALRPPRTTVARDLLILHAPFTTQVRFERKLRGIRAAWERFGGNFGRGEAWHWRYWMRLTDDAAVAAEFERQAFDRRGLAAAFRVGEAVFPADFFARRAALAPHSSFADARLVDIVALSDAAPASGEPAVDANATAWFDPWSFRLRYAPAGSELARATDGELLAYYERNVRRVPLSASALFDEARYRANNSDVARAVEAGDLASGLQHFVRYGHAEGRTNLPGFHAPFSEIETVLGLTRAAPRTVTWFEDAFYRAVYPDVDERVARGDLPSALEHFLAEGYAEGRLPHPAAFALGASRDACEMWADLALLAEWPAGAPRDLSMDDACRLRDALLAREHPASLDRVADALRPFIREARVPSTRAAFVAGCRERTIRLEDALAWRDGVNLFGAFASLTRNPGRAAGLRATLAAQGIAVDAYDVGGLADERLPLALVRPADLAYSINVFALAPELVPRLAGRFGFALFSGRANVAVWDSAMSPVWRAILPAFDAIVAGNDRDAGAFRAWSDVHVAVARDERTSWREILERYAAYGAGRHVAALRPFTALVAGSRERAVADDADATEAPSARGPVSVVVRAPHVSVVSRAGASLALFHETLRTQAYPAWDWTVVADERTGDAARAALRTVRERDDRVAVCDEATFFATRPAGELVMTVAGDAPPLGEALARASAAFARNPALAALYDPGCPSRAAVHPLDPYGSPAWSPESIASGFGAARVLVTRDDRYARFHAIRGRLGSVGDLASALELARDRGALVFAEGQLCAPVAWTNETQLASDVAAARELVAAYVARLEIAATVATGDAAGHLRVRPHVPHRHVFRFVRAATLTPPDVFAPAGLTLETVIIDVAEPLARTVATAIAASACDRVVIDLRSGGAALDLVALLEILEIPGVGISAPAHPSARGAMADRYASGDTFAIRRDVFDAAGGLDPGMGDAYAATDLAFRVHDAGFRCTITPYALAASPEPRVDAPTDRVCDARAAARFAARYADYLAAKTLGAA
jgi:hypothetical protein